MKDWAAGLTPISPVMVVAPVVVISDSPKITKLPAVPRLTGNGPAASAATGPARPSAKETTTAITIEFLLNPLMCFIYFVFLFN
jgi:hypothetical protein